MLITATVLEARVITLTSAHQFSTGNWLRISLSAMSPNNRSLGRQPGEGLHHHDIGQRVLRGAGER